MSENDGLCALLIGGETESDAAAAWCVNQAAAVALQNTLIDFSRDTSALRVELLSTDPYALHDVECEPSRGGDWNCVDRCPLQFRGISFSKDAATVVVNRLRGAIAVLVAGSDGQLVETAWCVDEPSAMLIQQAVLYLGAEHDEPMTVSHSRGESTVTVERTSVPAAELKTTVLDRR